MTYARGSPHEILEGLANAQRMGEDVLDELGCSNYATIRPCWNPARRLTFFDLFIETTRYGIIPKKFDWRAASIFIDEHSCLKEAILNTGKLFYPQLLKRSAGLALTLEALEDEKDIFIPRELINLFIEFSF